MSLIGSLEDLALGDILQILSLSRKSGILYLNRKGEEGRIIFVDGQITSASSTLRPNNILKLLGEKNIIPEGQMSKLLQKLKTGDGMDAKSLLIKSNVAEAKTIEDIIQSYITETIFNFFMWKEGNFDFEIVENSGKVYKPGVECCLETPLNPQYLAIEGARKIDETNRDTKPEKRQKDESLLQIKEMEEIIVIDRNADSQTFLKEGLESRGFRTAVMADLNSLYEYLETIKDAPRFPMVVGNLTIPKSKGEGMLGGMELLEWVVAEKLTIPIVLLSSINNEEVVKEAKLLGVYAYLKRPKRFARTSPEINAYMDILEKITALYRQYQEAGFTFKPGMQKKGTTVAEEREENDTGYKFIQDITEEITKEFQDETDLLPTTTGQKVETSPGLLTLKSMIEELMNPNFAGEVTLLIMRFASELLNRGILFLATKNKLKGLGQFGLEAFYKNPNAAVKKMEIEIEEQSLIGKVLKYKSYVKGYMEQTEENRKFVDKIGGDWPEESYAIPLLTTNKVIAIFYGDNVPLNKKLPDMTTFEIFMSQASVVMEKAYLERIIKEQKDEQ